SSAAPRRPCIRRRAGLLAPGCPARRGPEPRDPRLWDPGSDQSLLRLRTGLVELHSLAWSPDGLHLAVGGSEAVVLYQLTGRGARRFVRQASRGSALTLAAHPSQPLVASGDDQGEIELLGAPAGR